MSKTTTPMQYDKLVEIMETNRDIAQGFSKQRKEEVQAFWEKVASVLNALGPPSKGANAWRKVWIDWKSYVKRKISANKREMASTGGGHCNLQRISPLEEKVILLTGLETCTSGIRRTVDFGDIVEVEHGAEAAAMDISSCSADVNVRPSGSRGTWESREKRQQKASTYALFQEQINMQKDFYSSVTKHNEATMNKMDEMGTYLRRMNRSLEKLADTAEKQLAEQQRHNAKKEELLRQKIAIKMQMLMLEHPNHDFDWA